ncbi:N-acetylmuramoyl-L-alanine amidase [Muribaculum intestinale]|jgi:putative N-acetylmuramoyl-L-alanine amidase|uniref:N-acetylmuramoyl-L-alanine amidase n=1 Tax=Muribaculum intestinale TaxID=1796646 RepID=UPI0015A865FB|nr:N-acetylmuramoyl-L-alanine amidase [Muribaculum intestinale]DAI99883.1 MAG TPA: endodeoxyribonuclease I [Caudoviricetes sp.]DAN52447.1 MAG TPA: endodeoxyribonuclease I [Caudoviricetes sp.]
MRSITEIIVHCTATPEGKPFTVQQIRQWHTAPKPKGNGWRDIGYHYIVYLDGSVHNGRPVEQVGAHCSGHNAHSIGVCYVGGCDAHRRLPDGQPEPKDTRTPIQKTALRQLLKKLKERYPGARIYGHRDFAPKACPSFDATAEYSDL